MADSETRTLPAVAPRAGDDSTATETAAAPTTGPRPSPLPTVPRYTIVRQLGRGGMGVVYEAIGPLGVRVALKVVHPEKLTPVLLARFRQEARAMMDLAHPNLARIFDYGESDGGPYFTMKLLSGRTLADRLADLRADPAAGVRLAIRVADAVGHLHARGLVHRDLKPSNILLDDRGEPFVSDFGLIKDLAAGEADGVGGSPATPAGGASPTLTHTGARVGTEAYMSPEQFAGEQARIGPPTDVWALGIVLHELAWACRPGFAADRTVALPPDDGSAAVRTGLRPIVTRCLVWDPADRYPMAVELRADLEALLAPPAAPAAEPQPTRRFVLAATGASLLGLGAAGATWWAFTRPKGRGEPKSPPAPPDPLDEITKELADTGSVDLLGPDGRWRWSEWVAGDGEWVPGPPRDGAPAGALGHFRAPPGRMLMLELARKLTGFGYRLTVRMAHIGPGGDVGSYTGRSAQPVDGQPTHCWIGVLVRDYGLSPDPAGRPRQSRRLIPRSCSADGRATHEVAELGRLVDTGTPGDWVDVRMGLTVTELTAAAAGRPFPSWTQSQLLERAGRPLGFRQAGAAGLVPTFRPSEGLGLFAEDGAAIAVAAARLELVPENP